MRGVRYVLRTRPATCLEGALVLQAWFAAQGIRRAVVIGVAGSTSDFSAHAWLEGDTPGEFEELLRLPAR